MSGTERYGKRFPAGVTDLDIECWCYAFDPRPEGTGGRLTRWEHFKNIVDMCFNYEGSTRKVIWNEWTNRMIQAMIANRYVGLAGSGSSGKSDAVALFFLVECISAPTQTLCLLLSTTLGGARKRVWKSVNELWGSVESKWISEGRILPFKMVDSKGMLVGMDMNGRWSEAIGITLVAADKDNEKAAAQKLKGLKAPAEGKGRLRVGADEFSDLGESVLTAMIGNLNTNPDFKGVGMANPGSKLTPFGKFVRPKAGWKSVSLDDDQWESDYGVCLRFDALKSPRMITPEYEQADGSHSLYGWMPSPQSIDQMKHAFGEDSMEYWAQVRGMFCPTGMERTIWSEIELLNVNVNEVRWDPGCIPITVCALDPGFTDGGDRSAMVWGECGIMGGRKRMNILGCRVLSEINELEEDQKTVSERVIDQFKDHSNHINCAASRAGFDCTGAGVTFGHWIQRKWSSAVRAVNFSGAPEERRADNTNDEGVYANRVSQLWVQPKALVRDCQIMNIPMDIIDELCQRKYHQNNQESKKVWVESKKDMKKRTGRSPDLADAFCILVEVAILNGLLDVEEIRSTDRREQKKWSDITSGLVHREPGKSLYYSPTRKKLAIRKTAR